MNCMYINKYFIRDNTQHNRICANNKKLPSINISLVTLMCFYLLVVSIRVVLFVSSIDQRGTQQKTKYHHNKKLGHLW